MHHKKNLVSALACLLSLSFFTLGCGKAGASTPVASYEPQLESQTSTLLKDYLGTCYAKNTTDDNGVTITVNGYALSSIQARNIRWIKRCVLPFLPGTLEQKAVTAAHTSWWSLREGIMDLDGYKSIRYSLCHENGADRSRSSYPLYHCPTSIWQVGLAAGQVANYSDSSIRRVADQTFRTLDSRITDEELIAWSASLAGFPEGEKTHRDILSSRGMVRRSWLLRNPVIGFVLVDKQEVIQECLVQRKRWCFGGSYTAALRFARNPAALDRSVSDLKAVFLARE